MKTPAALPLRVVNWCADTIADPVHRLRFLQVAARLPDPKPARKYRSHLFAALVVVLLIAPGWILVHRAARVAPAPAPDQPAAQPPPSPHAELVSAVWPVEKSGGSETFSNGLRIDNHYSTTTSPRSYTAFRASEPQDLDGVHRSEPAGIVYHTTESRQAPFDPEQNGVLKMIGESTLEYVRRTAAYNFVIDRFGRVYRIVPEDQVANHAGHSVWSDEQWVYLDLNPSFLGVSFEAETSAAQLRAAAMLTEMLRSRYAIRAEDCITHGQFSVNPSNMQVGYHTDWGSSFPFAELGLPDNYARALPAVSLFGFEHDAGFLRAAGGRLAESVALAEENIRRAASASGVPVARYRKTLEERYWAKVAAMRRAAH
ncbi:MAG: N-acetylmuramoyl-L-alanine amidase [Bryobacteraceae bacterium]